MQLMRADLARGLEFALQEADHERPLDSLDTCVVRAYMAAQGIRVTEGDRPDSNCVRGWLDWADRPSRGG
jgi:hypothetical protein